MHRWNQSQTTWHCQQEAQGIPFPCCSPLWSSLERLSSLPYSASPICRPPDKERKRTLPFPTNHHIPRGQCFCQHTPSRPVPAVPAGFSCTPGLVCLTNRSMPTSCMPCWALPLRKWSTHFKGLFSTPQNLGILLKPKLPPQIISQCIRWAGMPRTQRLVLTTSSPFVREPNPTMSIPWGLITWLGPCCHYYSGKLEF